MYFYRRYNDSYNNTFLTLLKASKAPLEREKVNELLDIIKEHGVILGKGGPFGSVKPF